jgi:hypothetical protein
MSIRKKHRIPAAEYKYNNQIIWEGNSNKVASFLNQLVSSGWEQNY